ncbi:tagatose 1,6-diphosphate aldolase [bacterium]|nr:tagatose 1,6-diphosphate aldolase [bacterium]
MSIGKFRHLSRCTNAEGQFLILAIDHRANLREAIEKESGPIDDLAFRDFKVQVVEASSTLVTGVLADPAYALGALVAGRRFTGGLLSPLEVTDYGVHPSQRELQWIPGWGVEKVKRMGADGIKLLLPYHPELPSAEAKQQVVRKLVAECGEYDIPLYLEPIACAPAPGQKLSAREQREVTIEMTQLFCALGADVMKLQIPAEEAEWENTCRELSKVCTVPWALLSGGVDFETYCRQAEHACFYGASGVIVGRAVWSEACRLQGEARAEFLREQVPQRLRRLSQICGAAQPFWSNLKEPDPALDWYESY